MKKILKLSESDLHNLIKESVTKIVNEIRNNYGSGNYSDTFEFDFGDIINDYVQFTNLNINDVDNIYEILERNNDTTFTYEVTANASKGEPSTYDYPGTNPSVEITSAEFQGISDKSKQELGEKYVDEIYKIAGIFGESSEIEEEVEEKFLQKLEDDEWMGGYDDFDDIY